MDTLQSETFHSISVATLTGNVMLIGSGATTTPPALRVTYLQTALMSSSSPIVTPSPSDKVRRNLYNMVTRGTVASGCYREVAVL